MRVAQSDKHVVTFRQILFWPLQLMPLPWGAKSHEQWTMLEEAGSDCPWKPEPEAFTPDVMQFRERHYIEFITFLPYVQRLLYGEADEQRTLLRGRSPIRVFRRRDVAQVEIVFPGDESVLRLDVLRTELIFFYDLDVVILALEIRGEALRLQRAQEVLFRFGRAYPHFWHEDGRPSNCLKRVTWLGTDGQELGNHPPRAVFPTA